MVLGEPLGLLLRPLLRQAGHLIAILEDIPAKALPQGLLLFDWHNRRLLLLDNLQCNLLLHPDQLLLGPERQSNRGGEVFEPSCRMVCIS
jgi:hypothetical protein